MLSHGNLLRKITTFGAVFCANSHSRNRFSASLMARLRTHVWYFLRYPKVAQIYNIRLFKPGLEEFKLNHGWRSPAVNQFMKEYKKQFRSNLTSEAD